MCWGSPRGGGTWFLDALVLGDPVRWAHDLDPAPVHPRLDQVQFVERVFPILFGPQVPGHRIEGHPKAVADGVGEDLLDVGSHFPAHGRPGGEERVVGGHGAIVVEPDDHPGEVGVVGLRAAELVVWDGGPEAGQRRPGGEVLELAPTPTSPIRMYSFPFGPNAMTPAW